jgi:hypothetical protein
MGSAICSAAALPASSVARAQAPPQTIVGVWALNAELSDVPHSTGDHDGSGDESHGRYGRGGGGGGHRGGGGFSGGFGGGSRGTGGAPHGTPEEMQRHANAVRDILQPAERLTITRTDAMVIVTTNDGRTTRLATDGSKVKDDSTGIERRTRWEGERLVSDISGAGPGKITETYALDAESHRLVMTLQADGAARQPQRTQSGQDGENGPPHQQVNQRRVYDAVPQ